MSKTDVKQMINSPKIIKDISEEKKNRYKNNNNRNNYLLKNNKEKDERLSLTLSILGLSNLINFFNEKNISFIDLLLLSKESMKELELEMYQRNRIYNFSASFTKFSKDYTLDDLFKFFGEHKQFLFNKKIYEEEIIKNKIELNNINNNINQKKFIIINDENKNENDINYQTPRYNQKTKKKYNNNTYKKTNKGKSIIKKYLSLKKDIDEFLDKINKQKEDTEILSYKYNNFAKKINFYERNEDDIMFSEEKKNIKKNNINKILEKIKNLENKKIEQKTFEHLIQIKKYLMEKGNKLTIEEIFKLENEIDKMIELNIKKEGLKNDLKLYEKKIDENKKLINQLNYDYNNSDDN